MASIASNQVRNLPRKFMMASSASYENEITYLP